MDNIVFGPVPSRRLGRSLGINNIPYKICSYACVYCQIGTTLEMSIERKSFYAPTKIFSAITKRLNKLEKENVRIDYITFVPDGEPTLDLNIGKEANIIKETGYKTAIITNSSLLWRDDVQEDLMEFDLVSLKIDTVTHELWKKINRPHKKLRLEKILEGILEFSKRYNKKIITETMLIDGIDYSGEAKKLSMFISKINPEKAYISVPTRPPAERWVHPPDEAVVNEVYQVFKDRIENVELLINFEGEDFVIGDDVADDVLAIVSVHPMREDVLKRLLKEKGKDYEVIVKLLHKNLLRKVDYNGETFIMRSFKNMFNQTSYA